MLVHRCVSPVVRRMLQPHTSHRFPWQPLRRSYSIWYRRSDELTSVVYHNGLMERLLLRVNQFEVDGKRYASKKGGARKSSTADTSVGDGVVDLNKCKDEMSRSVDKLKQELQTKYSKTLALGTMDDFFVSVEGKFQKLMEVAEVKLADKEFHITPMISSKNIQKKILEGIEATGLNLKARIHEDIIKVTIPEVSAEYKQNLLKLSKAAAEKSRVALRKLRQQTLTQVKKHKDSISKDEGRLIEKQIDSLFDTSMKQIEDTFKEKINDLK